MVVPILPATVALSNKKRGKVKYALQLWTDVLVLSIASMKAVHHVVKWVIYRSF